MRLPYVRDQFGPIFSDAFLSDTVCLKPVSSVADLGGGAHRGAPPIRITTLDKSQGSPPVLLVGLWLALAGRQIGGGRGTQICTRVSYANMQICLALLRVVQPARVKTWICRCCRRCPQLCLRVHALCLMSPPPAKRQKNLHDWFCSSK